MLQMGLEKIANRAIFRFLFKKGDSEAQAIREICECEGDGAISHSTAERWFRKFCSGDESLFNEPHLGRPSAVDDEAVRAAALENLLASVLHWALPSPPLIGTCVKWTLFFSSQNKIPVS
jgi:hypothetical protein